MTYKTLLSISLFLLSSSAFADCRQQALDAMKTQKEFSQSDLEIANMKSQMLDAGQEIEAATDLWPNPLQQRAEWVGIDNYVMGFVQNIVMVGMDPNTCKALKWFTVVPYE